MLINKLTTSAFFKYFGAMRWHCPVLKTLSAVSVVFVFLTQSCKPKDVEPLLPVTAPDSTMSVQSLDKTDVNEFDINYQFHPDQQTGDFSNVFLYWSTNNAFSSEVDSVLLSSSIFNDRKGKFHVAGLRESTSYYTRLSAIVNGRLNYSATKSFMVDSLAILNIFGVDSFPINISRGPNQNSQIFTNLSPAGSSVGDTSAHVMLGDYNCPITSDQGYMISFEVPTSIPAGQYYELKLRKKGMDAQSAQPLYVLKNLWTDINPPDVPVGNSGYSSNGIGFYGTCQSADKGYMVGGIYLHTLNIPANEEGSNTGPYSIQVLDGSSQQWSQIMPSNPRLWAYPVTYFYNNSIYVLSGEIKWPVTGNILEQNMWRLDLGSNTWIQMDPLPFAGIDDPVSFEVNGNWYIGLGFDLNDKDSSGIPKPSKKFWKYDPAAGIWAQVADFPGSTQVNPTGFTIGSKAYVFCGAITTGLAMKLSDYSEELWQFDPSANSWAQLSLPAKGGPVPGERYSIVSYNGKAQFFTGEALLFMGTTYGYVLENSSLEYDPQTGSFTPIAYNSSAGIMRLVYSKGNKYIFQSDALGYIDNIPNRTNQLSFDP